jgi:putative DNA primase/helicase
MMDELEIRLIAKRLGGDVTGRDSANVPGPGHSAADRSLSIKLNSRAPGGFVVYSHAGDDPVECRKYVCAKLGLLQPRRGKYRREPLIVADGGEFDEVRRKAFALKLWAEAADPIGSLVERYLRDHRGLTLAPDVANSTIRFHRSLYYNPQARLPAMVCLLRNIETDEPCGIHRTFLDSATGQKIARKMLGIARGAAIKFDVVNGQGLTIGEGTETVLSARAAGFTPAWAVGSSNAVKAFPVLSSISELTVLEENDPASRDAVQTCAKRYLHVRKPVNIVTPTIGNDFNDAWRATR